MHIWQLVMSPHVHLVVVPSIRPLLQMRTSLRSTLRVDVVDVFCVVVVVVVVVEDVEREVEDVEREVVDVEREVVDVEDDVEATSETKVRQEGAPTVPSMHALLPHLRF